MTNPAMQSKIGRRDFLKAGAAAAAAAAMGPLAAARAADGNGGGKRPNIVYIFSDEHRWCSLPFTEMPELKTPNMERLASQSMGFDNCVSNSPICVPHRGMLITGQWPHQSSCVSNHWFGNGAVIGLEAPTIAHSFKKAGYTTGYVGKWHLKNETCRNAGFDYFKHWLYGDDHWATRTRDIPSGEEFHVHKGYNAIGMTDQTIDFIKDHADDDNPFMMILSLNPPHWRWDDAPEEFVKQYPDGTLSYRPNVQDRYKKGKEALYYKHYHAHISAVDQQIGRLMDTIDELGIAEDTILVYTADHGSSFGSNGVGSKANPFDEAIRVPFLIRWPGRIAAGKRVDNLLGSIDLNPTICALAGVKPAAECRGRDFSPVMLGKKGPDPSAQLIAVNNFPRNYYRTLVDEKHKHSFCPYRGVRTKRYTYVVASDGEWLLYDNEKDPYQLKNLINDPAFADVKRKCQEQLKALLAEAEDPYISDEWRKLSLPDRIAAQNQHFTLLASKREWDRYKAGAVKAYLAKAGASGKKAELRAAADRVFDAPFFGLYKALDTEIKSKRAHTKRPKAELRAELAAHEKKAAALFETEAKRICQAG